MISAAAPCHLRSPLDGRACVPTPLNCGSACGAVGGCSVASRMADRARAHALTFPPLLPEAISRGQGDGIGAWTEDTQTLGPTPFSRVGLGSDGKHFALVGILNYVVISK